MNENEIDAIWSIIESNYNKYLKNKGVKLPALKSNGKYTKNALVLIKLAEGYPNTKIVSKEDLTKFIREFYPDTNDVR